MTCLWEQEVQQEPQRLPRAWEDDATFVFLPNKTGVDLDWIHGALSQLPAELQTGHYALLTSGTTGAPKLVVGQRQRSENLAGVLHEWQLSEPVAETIVALPLSYSYAFVNQWLWTKCHHRTLRLTTGLKDPESLRATLRSARQAMICLVGVQIPLLGQCCSDESFPGVIRVHFAGGRFPQENLPLVRRLFPEAMIFNNYGCAEALPRLTLRPADTAEEAADIGRPLPGIELTQNDANELLFRSPYGAVGVVEDSQFKSITPDDWVKTGDLGQATEGGFWRLLGRASEVFKRHGEKVSLASLQNTVARVWSGQAAFYRAPDPHGEEGHVLLLAPPPPAGQIQEILRALRKHHSRAQWPLRIEATEAIPLLPNGKPDVRGAVATGIKSLLWYQRI